MTFSDTLMERRNVADMSEVIDTQQTIVTRCPWANPRNPRYLAYHDEEWGVPCHDEIQLFEMLNLEGAQAGLSWETVLNKRDSYRQAFDDWHIEKIAAYDAAKVSALLAEPGIVRNRLKIAAVITNAQALLKMHAQGETLSNFLWQHVDNVPIQNAWSDYRAAPAKTDLSDAISKSLKKRGFKFIGSTIIYAYMQAIGMVNDHALDCCRYHAVKALSE